MSGNWFEDIINQYSEVFTQKLYDLLKSMNDLGGNATSLLTNVLTDPSVSQEHIQEMIAGINEIGGISITESSSSEFAINLKDTINDLSTAQSQLDILNKLIFNSTRFSNRVALFIISGERTIGWLAWGFVEAPSQEISRKKLDVAYNPNAIIFRVRDSAQIFKGQPENNEANAKLFQDLGGLIPAEIACIPLITKNRVSGVLYLDQGSAQTTIPDISELEVEVMIAGMMIDLIPLRKTFQQAEEQQAAQAHASAPTAGLPFQTMAAPTPPQVQPQSALPFMHQPAQPPTPAPAHAPAYPQGQNLPPFMAPAAPAHSPYESAPVEEEAILPPFASPEENFPEQPSFLTPGINIPEAPAAPRTGTFGMNQQPQTFAPQPPPPSPAPPVPGQIGFHPNDDTMGGTYTKSNVTQFPGPAAQDGLSPEIRQAYEEAKRFARLLILEIKLYNEDKVMEGRRNRNLYSLLKEEIDRSHEVYKERISGDVSTTTDFFKEELINILAGGDPTALGV